MNIFELSGMDLSQELTEILAESESVRIEKIISSGQISDWYDQSESEFIALLSGESIIEFDDGNSISLSKGDTLLIKPHKRHRVSFTSTDPVCIWLCVFYN
jgi:cupin 2 domain-containing protein